MMQSILLTSPSNSQASEPLFDTPAIDKQPKSDALSQQEGGLAGHFSDLFGSAIADNEKGEKDKNVLGEEDSAEIDELASDLLLDTLSNEADSEISPEEFELTSTEEHSQESEETVTENELLLEKGNQVTHACIDPLSVGKQSNKISYS